MESILGFPPEFAIFALTLLGIASFHKHSLPIALTGLTATLAYKLFAHGDVAHASTELALHFGKEWVVLVNLLLLLLGFAALSNQFERSKLPEAIPARLPKGWLGGFTLLVLVFAVSIFLDNIAGAIIGGVVARHVYANHVGIGFIAAIAAAANAGGAGSVIGDTTTTMMWVGGISPLELAPAFVGAIVALTVFGIPAAFQQERTWPIGGANHTEAPRVDWTRAGIVVVILLTMLTTNLLSNGFAPELESHIPVLGLGLWTAILVTALVRRPDWTVVSAAVNGAMFLIALVALASLMPVNELPAPTQVTTFGLGALSAVFDNIPLTALALKQGGYDWALLAYSVGFGGSMLWFGSSAGVALTSLFPEGRSVVRWLRHAWYVPLAYGLGFAAMLLV
ncbi:MAG: citrate transporter [Alphaproteobacteria bacterium]|nr:citrate transporter [Alphaproteobacteria bacterium]